MKVIRGLIMIVVIGFSGCDEGEIRKSDMPSVVLNGFKEKFPNGSRVEWEKKADLYEAEFEIQNVEYEAILNAEGTLFRFKHEISFNDLPEAVQTAITTDFDKAKIDDVELLQVKENRFYQIEFEKEFKDRKTIFEESGRIFTETMVWF